MKFIKQNNKAVLVELPKEFKGVENVITEYHKRTDLHGLDGFYRVSVHAGYVKITNISLKEIE